MHREDSLDADSEADSTHRERFAQHFAAAAHHHALEWLDTLFIAFAFFQADVDANGIARAEFGEILAELRVLHTANYRFHFYFVRADPLRWGQLTTHNPQFYRNSGVFPTLKCD